ncbi:hypothetical protein CYY_005669 [Polysphondylium violaceum]|uniref:methenyltetrahydrofolate cyclohydrolase n=1 Tax=Polysphondylium violaceum TaxID=133409 RepID=A0A8J4PRK0_9MYCE|nr:hypothetical protein CYY_005669 [Polysphondylium violaceum]
MISRIPRSLQTFNGKFMPLFSAYTQQHHYSTSVISNITSPHATTSTSIPVPPQSTTEIEPTHTATTTLLDKNLDLLAKINETQNVINKKPKREPIKLNGTLLSNHIIGSIKKDVEEFKANSGVVPQLVVIYVGDNKQIESFIKMKKRASESVGFKFTLDKYDSSITEEQLIKQIQYHSEDPSVHGIIVQLPLPEHLENHKIIQSIDPKKDVDGLNSINLGQIFLSKKPLFIPCTPLGILELFKAYNIKAEGKNVVVLGRSNLVGRTIATLLSQKDMTNPCIMGGASVTLLHKYSTDIDQHLKQADIIISATGVGGLIKKENVKKGVILIDVGISHQIDPTKKSGYKLTGDVDPETYSRSIAYTPVPGGVGPLTVAMLLRNTLKSAILHYKIQTNRMNRQFNEKLQQKQLEMNIKKRNSKKVESKE